MKFADLHSHTTCSDGILTPAALVAAAKRTGLAALAITDHDTLDAIVLAKQAGIQLDIEVIAGVELTSAVRQQEVHILGYFPDQIADSFAPMLAFSRDVRDKRIVRMLEALNNIGIALTTADILTAAGSAVSIGRPHVARALLARGYVKNVGEAFVRFLRPGKPSYVERYRMTVAEAVGHIRQAGGVAVLAHPSLADINDADIREMRDQGLQGIEVWHPEHTPGQSAHYQQLAADLGLLLTGGSDAHDDNPGVVRIPYELVIVLKEHRS
jgi:predicted metal-dependent phosphoesterase TrpH